jgi:uncharacterized protein DUF2470
MAEARIIAHMNGDHGRELSHYLRHHAGLSARSASRPWLKTLSLDKMTIAAGGLSGREFVVPFDPPMTSFAEARTRLIAMDAEARAALGLSDVYVDKYVAPRGVDAVVFSAVLFYFISYATVGFVHPGNPGIWGLLNAWFPGGASGWRWIVVAIFWPVVGIHVAEAWWIARSRLHPHGVNPFTPLWWAWIVSTAIEGFGAFKRIDRIVAEKRAQKEAKKH